MEEVVRALLVGVDEAVIVFVGWWWRTRSARPTPPQPLEPIPPPSPPPTRPSSIVGSPLLRGRSIPPPRNGENPFPDPELPPSPPHSILESPVPELLTTPPPRAVHIPEPTLTSASVNDVATESALPSTLDNNVVQELTLVPIQTKITMSNSNQFRNYVREVRDGDIYHKFIPGMTVAQRRDNACKISVILKRPGLISPEEQKAKGVYSMEPGVHHWIEDEEGNRIYAGIFLDEKLTRPWHNWMRDLQRASAEGLGGGLGENGKPSGVNQTVGISVQTGVGTIQPCATYPPGKVGQRKIMNVLGATMMMQMIQTFVPKEARDVMEATYNRNASFANGHENNMYSSSLQFNVSKPSLQGLDDIRDATDLHMDRGDDPQALSVVASLSNLHKDVFPGYFVQTSLQEYCIMAPFCVVIFPAWLPHKPIEPAPYQDRSVRYQPSMSLPPAPSDIPFLRITQVSYPSLIARTRKDTLRPSMFTDEARMFYGTERNYREMLTRKEALTARDHFEDLHQSIPAHVAGSIQQGQSWTGKDGVTQSPRLQKIVAVLEAPMVNPLLEDHKKITKAVTCGLSFANGKRRGIVDWQDREEGIFGDGVQLPDSFFAKPPPATIGKAAKSRSKSKSKPKSKQFPAGLEIHPVFHTSLLRLNPNDPLPRQIVVPNEPVLIDGELEYEVDRLLDAQLRYRNHKLHFRVKWVNLPPDSKWYPAAFFSNAPQAMADFYEQYPEAPREAAVEPEREPLEAASTVPVVKKRKGR